MFSQFSSSILLFYRNDDIFGDFESAPVAATPAATQEPVQAAATSGKKTNADILSLYGAAPQANTQFGGANNQFGGAFGAMSQPQQQNFGAFGGMAQQQPQQTNASNLDILGMDEYSIENFTFFRRFRKPDDTSATNSSSFHGC